MQEDIKYGQGEIKTVALKSGVDDEERKQEDVDMIEEEEKKDPPANPNKKAKGHGPKVVA